MRGNDSIMVHPVRAEQFKALAKAKGLTQTELVEEVLAEAIKRGELPDETIPGFEIHVADRHVWFVVGQVAFPPLPVFEANALASHFKHFGDPKSEGRARAIEIHTFVLKLGRKGRGVIVLAEDPENSRSAKVTITARMALDLSRQIRIAAAKAWQS